MEREIHVLYKRKEECCGCTACYAICPKEAISMVEDEEGFEYPQINENKSLAWSSVVMAFENSKRISEEVKKPKALGDIRGRHLETLEAFHIFIRYYGDLA